MQVMKMTFDLIRTFITLYETKNFNQTAKLLFISQPTVSVRIKALEDELNCTLFTRSNKQVEATSMGVQFMHYATRLYQSMSDCQRFITSYDRFENHLTVSAPVTCWEYGPLQKSVLSYCEINSDTLIYLLRDSSDHTYRKLIENEADLGVMYITPSNPDMEYIPYVTENLFLAVSPKMELPPQGDFLYTDRDLPNLVRPTYAATASKLVEESLYMLPCNIASDHPRLYLELVKEGFGIGLLQSFILEDELISGSLVMVECTYNEHPMQYKNYIAYLKRKEQNLQPLIDTLLKETQEKGTAKTPLRKKRSAKPVVCP